MSRKAAPQYSQGLTRRTFVAGMVAGSTLYGVGNSWHVAASGSREAPLIPELSGTRFDLNIG